MCDFAEHARKRYAAAATTLSSANSSSNDNAIPSTHATQAAAAAAAASGSNVPWLLGGYSVGALTAVHAALRQQGSWSGLVLVSAALGLHTHGLLTRYGQFESGSNGIDAMFE
jgi:pimeloyl-ACP methyl ester carboxylesterase